MSAGYRYMHCVTLFCHHPRDHIPYIVSAAYASGCLRQMVTWLKILDPSSMSWDQWGDWVERE